MEHEQIVPEKAILALSISLLIVLAIIMLVLIIFSGVQLIFLGVIGEYLGRIFIANNKHPQFFITKKFE